jgi:DNA sulfur modification protein DndE
LTGDCFQGTSFLLRPVALLKPPLTLLRAGLSRGQISTLSVLVRQPDSFPNFRTDEEADRLNTQFMGHLGVKVRYLPARLAIARSLSVSGPPAPAPDGMEVGKSIKGDTLFGTGGPLATWTALIVERSGLTDIDLKGLQSAVASHWRRGIGLLEEEWKATEEDPSRFLRRIMEASGLKLTNGGSIGPDGRSNDVESQGPIVLPIGEVSEDASTGEKISWGMNFPGGSPHVAIMGGVGSGKTRTAVAMLRSLREFGRIPLIAFDFKGDLGETPDGSFTYGLDKLFEGVTLRPPERPIPLDVLSLPSRTDMDVTFAAQRFLESFSRLKGSGVGAKQSSAVFEAAARALRTRNPCRLTDISNALLAVYAERNMKEDGATGTMEELCRFPLFEPIESPNDFFARNWVIALPAQVPERSRGIVVNLILDALDRHLNSLPEAKVDDDGNRALRVICVVDEAHRILSNQVPGLSSLMRQSRSKGGAIVLISQSPDDFSGEDDDFLNEMGLVVAFSTNAKPAQVSRLIGKGINLASLPTGHCVIKRRGDPSGRRVIAWRQGA